MHRAPGHGVADGECEHVVRGFVDVDNRATDIDLVCIIAQTSLGHTKRRTIECVGEKEELDVRPNTKGLRRTDWDVVVIYQRRSTCFRCEDRHVALVGPFHIY